MSKLLRVALDGPSGAGKSTIAKELAKNLSLDYIDTGAMYRAIGYKLLKEEIDISDESALQRVLDSTDIDFNRGNVILDGEIVNDVIRTPQISKAASKCSALAPVRKKLVELQRNMGRTRSVIMDGRDIGTNVLTDAEYKFFLTASPEERAERRYKELLEKGEKVDYDSVLLDINTRDYNDTHRQLNPLKKADDAIEIDSTGLSIEEVTECIMRKVK